MIVTDIVNRENVRVAERGGGAGLLGKTLQAVRIAREGCRQDLDGDVAAEASIAGTIDLTHAACADGGLNVVGTELAAGSQHEASIITGEMGCAETTDSRRFRRGTQILSS